MGGVELIIASNVAKVFGNRCNVHSNTYISHTTDIVIIAAIYSDHI